MSRRGATWTGTWVAALMLMLASGGPPTHGAEPGRFDVAAGFGGRWKVGSWTPLVVSATGGGLEAGQEVRLWAEDDDGQFVRSPAVRATQVGDRVEARLCVRFGRPSGRYRVEVTSPGGGAATTEDRLVDPIVSTDHVIVAYGDLPSVARAARLVDRDRGSTTVVVSDTPPYAASESQRSFDAADAIVISGHAATRLPVDVREGLDAWVRDGGSLVFVCGASAAEAAATGSPVSGWLPGAFEKLVRLRRLGPIEAYARAGGLVDRVPPDGLPVPRFAGPTPGIVLVSAVEAGGGPVVARWAHGLGTVIWLGLDLDAEPLRGWSGCDTLLAAALGGRSRGGLDQRSSEQAGMPDMAGQLHAALDTFPAAATSADQATAGRKVSPVPFEVIAGLGLLYVLCLYPLDWWFVSKQGRPWIAWLTLPILAAGFTAAAWGLKGQWGGGREAIARTADVIDVDAGSGHIRGTSWLAVLSPVNDRLTVAVEGATGTACADRQAAVTWWGVAGRGFGGLDAAVGHPSLAAADYGYGGSLAALDDVPIAAAASRLFEAEWSGCADVPVVTSSLALTSQATLAGAVSHHLPFPIENCRLLHAGWLYDVGTLRPGDRYDTATGRGPRSLASALTRRAAAKDRETALTWDPTNADVARIIEVAAFQGAAGGTAYTGLDAGRLGRLDLSPLLAVDRAVLVGTVAEGVPASRWDIGGGAGPMAAAAAAPPLCRIVIPLAAEAVP
ncbi:MAG: hypothetical protein DWI04_01690 [Planctomycetota bacterium]|nr:MAG: hypothetical protein DWI04_01690 [Planctomycetota bacterium]